MKTFLSPDTFHAFLVHEVRDPSRLPVSDPKLRVVRGDVLDLGSVQPSLAGAEAAISVLGVPLGHSPGLVPSKGTGNIASALLDQLDSDRFLRKAPIVTN